MAKKVPYTDLQSLPLAAAEFVRLVIKKMRYRKSVRADVMAELAAHFEDALKDCKSEDEREQRAQRLIADFGDVKLLGVLLRRAKKRCRPLWRTIVARTFQTIGVLILCFVLYCVYISLGEPTISIDYMEEATRLARPVVDEGLNAAPLYQKAIDAYNKEPEIRIEPEIAPSRCGSDPNRPPEKIVEMLSLLQAIGDGDWIGDLNEEELSLMQQWIASNKEAIEYFRQAAEKPHCWWHRQAKSDNLMAVLMPELNGIRNLSRLTCWQAKLEAYNGDTKAAFDDLLTCYRTGIHFKGPRSLIEQIVGIAVQALFVKNALVILDNQQIDDQLLKNFQNELEILMDQDFHAVDYTVESFLGLDFIQRCYTDNGSGSGHLIPGRLKEYWQVIDQHGTDNEFLEYTRSLAGSLVGANREQMTREFEKYYTTAQRWAHKTPWQLKKEKVDTKMGMDEWSGFRRARYWPFYMLAPALTRVSELSYRAKAQIEALVTTLAAIRYKQVHGDYPENLRQLLADHLIKKLPADPYSDGPLVYKKTDDGFTLYSVGENFLDDAGEIFRTDTGRVEKWPDEGDAVFWPVYK
jgi:tetratricopeptide (TPR) repeat protein